MSGHLAIFADGSPEVGLGHLTRMRSLVGWTKAKATVITRTVEQVKAVFAEESVEIVAVEEPHQIASAVEKHASFCKVLVIDPPIHRSDLEASSGPSWQAVIDDLRARGLAVVRFTDELSPTAHNCDLLVNDHPHAQYFAGDYFDLGEPTRVLAGPQYFLIDPAHEVSPDRHDGLFVSFGGSDHSDLLPRIKAGLLDLSRQLMVHVVVGHDATNDLECSGNLVVHRFLEPRQFAKLLVGARAALTASGNTLFERVYHQVPGVSIAQFSHQDSIGRAFADLGITRHLGLARAIVPNVVIAAATALIDDRAARTAQIEASRSLDIRHGCAEIVRGIGALQ